MKHFTLLWPALTILALAACTFQENPEFQLGQSLLLKSGQTAEWKDDPEVKISFDSTTEDSRCPQGIQCVWAGRAIMAVTFTQNGLGRNSALVMGDPAGTPYSNEAVFGDFTVQLIQVKPHPIANQKVPKEQYVIEIEIRKGD